SRRRVRGSGSARPGSSRNRIGRRSIVCWRTARARSTGAAARGWGMATIDENLRRVPPQSLEAEESVLGGIMLDNTVIDRVIGVLQPVDFYRGAHRKVFRAMVDLTERSEPVDLITLSETLKARRALTAGLQPSDLIIVAGRPSMGKTAFCLNIAEHAALRTDTGVAIFSLEMAKEQLAMRMLCSEARVDLARVRTGHLSDREFPKLS